MHYIVNKYNIVIDIHFYFISDMCLFQISMDCKERYNLKKNKIL